MYVCVSSIFVTKGTDCIYLVGSSHAFDNFYFNFCWLYQLFWLLLKGFEKKVCALSFQFIYFFNKIEDCPFVLPCPLDLIWLLASYLLFSLGFDSGLGHLNKQSEKVSLLCAKQTKILHERIFFTVYLWGRCFFSPYLITLSPDTVSHTVHNLIIIWYGYPNFFSRKSLDIILTRLPSYLRFTKLCNYFELSSN